MSYAGHANLITLQLSDSSTQVDSQLKRMLATSLVVHAVLLLGLMSVRFAPTVQHPLASYHVDLVTLPEPNVAPPVENRGTVKKAVPPPTKPQVTSPASTPAMKKAPPPPAPSMASTPTVPLSSPQMGEPIQAERIMPSIVDALENVAVPRSREITPMAETPTVKQPPAAPERKNTGQAEIPMPVIPRAPQLAVQKSSSAVVAPIRSASEKRSFADTLKQAVQSVIVPQKSSRPKAQTFVPVTPKNKRTASKPKVATVEPPRITTPGQAPQLAKVTPVPKTKGATLKMPPQSRLSDSLKQVTQSVVVPEVRKTKIAPQKLTQAVAVQVPSVPKIQQKPREKLQGMVIPSEAPNLATVDVENARKSLPNPSVVEDRVNVQDYAVEPKIAKLPIPDVPVPAEHHILSTPTESGMQNTKTALQVSGSSPEGNAYWGRVWSKIDREWVAPKVEISSGKSLQVVVAFRIERNGSVKNLSIEHSSGNEYYDLAAKRAILDAMPLPQFTIEMPESFHDIQFQFTVNVSS